MSLKPMTIALIAALVYEILLKLSHLFTPSIFMLPLILKMTTFLSIAVGALIILFVWTFRKTEKLNENAGWIALLLTICYILKIFLRLPVLRNILESQTIRASGEIIGLTVAVLLFVFMMIYKQAIPRDERALNRAVLFVLVLFMIGIIRHLMSTTVFIHFIVTGVETHFSLLFHHGMFGLFLVSHITVICFLIRYYQFKYTAN